jgi:hypothetical protein
MDHEEITVHPRMLTISMGMCSRHPATGCEPLFIKNPLLQQRVYMLQYNCPIPLHLMVSTLFIGIWNASAVNFKFKHKH